MIRVEASQATVGSLQTSGNHDVRGRYEVQCGISGQRSYIGKFPAEAAVDVRKSVADLLGLDVSALESFVARDEKTGEWIFLLEVRDAFEGGICRP